jgi:hypothetical protein
MSHKLTAKEFENLQLINNFIVVKPDPGNHKIVLKSGAELYLDTSFEVEKHAVTTGTVVYVPDKLRHHEQYGTATLSYITDQELCCGDKVIFHYNESVHNIKESRYIECEEQIYFLVKYDTIFCAIRTTPTGEQLVIPVNGIVIVEADDAPPPFESEHFVIPEISLGRKSETQGVIRYIGSPLKGYYDYKDVVDLNNLTEGDHVVFNKRDSVPLQYDLHQSLDKGKTLYRMRRMDIYGKLEDSIHELLV